LCGVLTAQKHSQIKPKFATDFLNENTFDVYLFFACFDPVLVLFSDFWQKPFKISHNFSTFREKWSMSYYQYFFSQTQLNPRIMDSILCIDGVVGAGKTTLGEMLAQEMGLEFFKEPVDNNPLLEKFYHDQGRYSFPMQVYFLNKRFKMIKQADKMAGCVMDRSIYGL
jgi:Deoxynucleoside kinase